MTITIREFPQGHIPLLMDAVHRQWWDDAVLSLSDDGEVQLRVAHVVGSQRSHPESAQEWTIASARNGVAVVDGAALARDLASGGALHALLERIHAGRDQSYFDAQDADDELYSALCYGQYELARVVSLADYLGDDPVDALRRSLEIETLACDWSGGALTSAVAKLRASAQEDDGLVLVTDERELRHEIRRLVEQEALPPNLHAGSAEAVADGPADQSVPALRRIISACVGYADERGDTPAETRNLLDDALVLLGHIVAGRPDRGGLELADELAADDADLERGLAALDHDLRLRVRAVR